MGSLEILPRAYSGTAWNVDSIYIPLSSFWIFEDIFEARIHGFDVYQFITNMPGMVGHLIAQDLSDRVVMITANQLLERNDLPDLLSGKFYKYDWCRDDIEDKQEDLVSKELLELIESVSIFMAKEIQKDGKWCVLGL